MSGAGRKRTPRFAPPAPGARRASAVVPAPLDGERLDRALAALVPDLSRTLARKVLQMGGVHLGRERCRVASRPVREGDVLTVTWHPEVTTPARFDLEVVYEDARVIAVSKPAGQHVQGTELGDEGTLVRALERRFGPATRLLHRIDAPASGVLLAAKDAEAVTSLSRHFRDHTIERSYLALTAGRPADGPCEVALRRRGRVMEACAPDAPGAEPARTDVEVVSFRDPRALVRCRLHTGRTHQVRVHLASLGAPIVGDRLYGGPDAPRLMLHAERLAFPHPDDGRRVEVLCPPPPELAADSYLTP